MHRVGRTEAWPAGRDRCAGHARDTDARKCRNQIFGKGQIEFSRCGGDSHADARHGMVEKRVRKCLAIKQYASDAGARFFAKRTPS